jgi:hypothetical protein
MSLDNPGLVNEALRSNNSKNFFNLCAHARAIGCLRKSEMPMAMEESKKPRPVSVARFE